MNDDDPGVDYNKLSEEELEKSQPQAEGEVSLGGHMTNPEEAEEKDTLEHAQEFGLHKDASEDRPSEL